MTSGRWIPERIWTLKGLSILERLFLAEVAGFVDTGRECFASNEYFAERLDCSEVQVRKMIVHLLETGYLDRDGYGRTRKLSISELVPSGTCSIQNKRSSKRNKNLFQMEQLDVPNGTHTKLVSRIKSTSIDTNKGKPDILMPFEGSEFVELWASWKEYKRTHFKFSFRTLQSEQVALHHLQKISNGDYETARTIIGTAIANGWRGLYPSNSGTGKGRTGGNAPEWHKRFTGEL